jgi:hypothetical protein
MTSGEGRGALKYTYANQSLLLCNTMNGNGELGPQRADYSEWWHSADVREARDRAKYDDGEGTLVDVMTHLLAVVDEREANSLPAVPVGEAFHEAAVALDEGRVPNGAYCKTAIVQMLDLGADVERLKTKFSAEQVDAAAAQYRTWRCDVITAARKGATANELLKLVPKGTWWKNIAPVLELHGFHLDPPTDRRFANADTHEQWMIAYAGGHTLEQVAEKFGVSKSAVHQLVQNTRKGKKPQFEKYLERDLVAS